MNRLDNNLVESVADLWQQSGGDADGFVFLMRDILAELRLREDLSLIEEHEEEAED